MNFSFILLFVSSAFYASCTASDPAVQLDPAHKSCSVAECINNGNTNRSSVILCNGCMDRILSNYDATSLFQAAQRKLDNFGQKKLADLNVDVLSLIFDDLDLSDMMKLLKAYPAKVLRAVAKQNFWRKYKGYEVHFDEFIDVLIISIDHKSKRITISSKESRKLLKIFGDSIQYVYATDLKPFTMQNINKFGGNLIRLRMRFDIVYDALSYLTTPFTAVEELELDIIGRIESGNLPLNQLFPKVR